MADPTTFDPAQLAALVNPPQSGVMDKIGNILGHPLVQAALGTYFGAISTPREYGLGGAIGRGGLAGLQGFEQARQMQQQLPLLRAKAMSSLMDIPLKQQEISEKGAHAGLLKAETGQYLPPEPDFAKTLSLAAQSEPDPTLALTKQLLSVGLANGGMKSSDAAKILSTAAIAGSQVALRQAQVQLAQETGQLRQEQTEVEKMKPAEIQAHIGAMGTEAGAAAEKANIEASLAGPRAAELAASTKLKEGQLAALPGKTANAAMAKVNTDLGRFFTTNPAGAFSDHNDMVNKATAYATAQNPGADPAAIRQAAEALTPASGLGATLKGMFTGVNPGAPPQAQAAPPKAAAIRPSATSVSGKPIYTWPDGTHHYNPPPM